MLAAIINPSYGTLFFMARLLPVKNFTAEFMHDVANSVLEVGNSAGDRVLSLICEDWSLNKKTHEIFQGICLKIFQTIGVLKKN